MVQIRPGHHCFQSFAARSRAFCLGFRSLEIPQCFPSYPGAPRGSMQRACNAFCFVEILRGRACIAGPNQFTRGVPSYSRHLCETLPPLRVIKKPGASYHGLELVMLEMFPGSSSAKGDEGLLSVRNGAARIEPVHPYFRRPPRRLTRGCLLWPGSSLTRRTTPPKSRC